jgi:hypothetical protein
MSAMSIRRGLWAVVALAATAVLAADPPAGLSQPKAGLSQLKAGLHLIDLGNGDDQYLGPYYNPSVDPQHALLYADDDHGTLVRWSLAKLGEGPQVFARPPARQPGWRFPVAASDGGCVAAFQAYPVKEPAGVKARIAVTFMDQSGRRLSGDLPLYYADDRWNGAASLAWRPTGELAAFYLTVGNSLPGLYVFRPSDKNWVRVHGLDAATGPASGKADGALQWETGGRCLSELAGGQVHLLGGAAYAEYGHFAATAVAHTWLDMDTLVLADPAAGLLKVDIGGQPQGTVSGWPGAVAGDGNASAPVAQSGRLAWVAAMVANADGSLRYVLRDATAGAATAKDVLSFDARPGYARGNAGPVWHPNKDAVFLSVPPRG